MFVWERYEFIMSFMKKMKDILFDEDEIEETKEEKVVETKPLYSEPKVPVVEKVEQPKIEKLEETKEVPSVFMDFDEDEFENSVPFVPAARPMNKVFLPVKKVEPQIHEYERTKVTTKRTEFSGYTKVETHEVKEKKKFKPSLIISPVYGVLNEDYTPADIKTNEEIINTLDIDEVRKKAYGNLDVVEETPKKVVYEEKETITVKPKYMDREKVKSIDELLQDSADNEFDLNDTLDLTNEIEFPSREKNIEIKKETIIEDEDDSLENDLFDLIDSMYERKEEVI